MRDAGYRVEPIYLLELKEVRRSQIAVELSSELARCQPTQGTAQSWKVLQVLLRMTLRPC
jgi:hypothetical protein